MLYENKQTLEKENAVRVQLEQVLGVSYKKLPIQYGMDWAAVDDENNIHHWAEVKCRDFELSKYDEFVLSFEKILKAIELSRSTGLQSFLYLGFTSGEIICTRIDHVEEWAPVWGGRTVKTRRAADVHPVVMIPKRWFSKVV